MQRAWGDEEYVENFGLKARRQRPLGIPRCRWEDLREIGRVWIVFIWLTVRIGGGVL
jgi:hypothetical protein